MSQIHTPFNGLFKTDGHLFDGGFRWDFDHSDLNESAKALFHHLDRVFEILRAPGFAFLSTIELDAEPGRFPEVLSQYFWDPDWADTQSFFVAAIARTAKESTYPVGRLTFEAKKVRPYECWRRMADFVGALVCACGVCRSRRMTFPTR
jgi:hypothetical protein